MKKIIFVIILFIIAPYLMANDNEIMKILPDKTYIINTSSLCNIKGFRGTTPLEVYIRNGKVVEVIPLQNQESSAFFSKIKKCLLPLYNNIKIKKAAEIASQDMVDGCTGASYSTKAVQQNIRVALDYYENNK